MSKKMKTNDGKKKKTTEMLAWTLSPLSDAMLSSELKLFSFYFTSCVYNAVLFCPT